MTLEELESAWSALQQPGVSGAVSGRRAVGLPANRPVYLAVDSRRRRHLLVQVPDDTTPLVPQETKSLEVTTTRCQVGSNPEFLYVDLVCTDPAQHATFCAIAQDLIRSLSQSAGPLRDLIVSVLARWRAFWMSKAGGMTREEALGLFGELWFLRRWLITAGTTKLACWQATDSARHDFQSPEVSVEVKTAATQILCAPVHHIGSLDQLGTPEHGNLFLFSLQVCDDALAANTLHSLVSSLVSDLEPDPKALGEFNDKLAARGYSPADQQAPARPLRVLAERLYRVDSEFPKLTRQSFQPAGLPTGIRGVEYEIDLATCDSWLVATRPQDGKQFLS